MVRTAPRERQKINTGNTNIPIQQMFATYLSNVTGISHRVIAMIRADLAGVTSWELVEKRSMYLGKQVAQSLSLFGFQR